MEKSKAKLLVEILFQIRAICRLSATLSPTSSFDVKDISAHLNHLMNQALASEDDTQFLAALLVLREYVKETLQKFTSIVSFNNSLLQVLVLLDATTNSKPHV